MGRLSGGRPAAPMGSVPHLRAALNNDGWKTIDVYYGDRRTEIQGMERSHGKKWLIALLDYNSTVSEFHVCS